MLKAVQLIKKFSIFALWRMWRSQFEAKIQVIRCKLRVAAR